MNNINNLFELVELQENINSLIESSLVDLNNNELELLIESSEDSSMLTLGATLATGGLAAMISRKNAARYIGSKLATFRKLKAPKALKIPTVKVNVGKKSPIPTPRPVAKPSNTATVPMNKNSAPSKVDRVWWPYEPAPHPTVPMNKNSVPSKPSNIDYKTQAGQLPINKDLLKPLDLQPSLKKFLDNF